ncbi:MAG TPA: dihydrofolate reductase [Bacteroidales bacterium]|nr:dihydrofolate reductase [Bacteroidales bacterium]HOK75226.1 dihydrofolate reductase [Bacteroidales bacterium]HOU31439.1 dihydrofolate reductase [Bacteroidales bacterium]HPP93519.1 dihydrofolate reductase [Bacteroidales bacterium]HQK71115.1 dihydrofolate reductase [Bacteroidales bacterium]
MISIIAAVSEDLGIGKDNKLLWNIPEDLKRFKKLTTGRCVIMGKKTWESLPVKPLPGRKNIVVTDNPGDRFNCDCTAFSVEEALQACKGEEEVFVIGGGSIYRQFMPLADRLYITHVHDKAPADTFFPEIDPSVWEIISEEFHDGIPGYCPSYTYRIYRKK